MLSGASAHDASCHLAISCEDIMQTKINWFEIPSNDFARATRFYEALFDTTLRIEGATADLMQMAIFTYPAGVTCGCVTHSEHQKPSSSGTMIYLDAGASIDAVIQRIAPAGGKVYVPKTQLPDDIGYMAHFVDTEGNLIGLHAMH
jgi:predicted enzyme related to lactoylglutathione lyase